MAPAGSPVAPASFSVRVLSRRFRRVFLERLEAAFTAGTLTLTGSLHALRDAAAWARYLAPVRRMAWGVYAKRPFAGPEQVLEYVGRYRHRVAISNDHATAATLKARHSAIFPRRPAPRFQ